MCPAVPSTVKNKGKEGECKSNSITNPWRKTFRLSGYGSVWVSANGSWWEMLRCESYVYVYVKVEPVSSAYTTVPLEVLIKKGT
jgi:hypothetical protein